MLAPAAASAIRLTSFALAVEGRGDGWAQAGIIKDAGDDPDVTHRCTVISTVRFAAKGCGIVFRAGKGVGTITKPGLPIPPGEPAINPVPRQMMSQVIAELGGGDVEIEISIPNGEELAKKSGLPLRGRLIVQSVLGLDCLDPSWRRCGACRRAGAHRRLHRVDVGGSGACPLRSAA